jgi:hypothetical protein
MARFSGVKRNGEHRTTNRLRKQAGGCRLTSASGLGGRERVRSVRVRFPLVPESLSKKFGSGLRVE